MGGNIFSQGMDAYRQAYDDQNQMGQDRAKIQAGRSLSQGDYNGAAAQLGNAGMIGPQTQLMEAGHDQEVKAAQLKADNLVKVAQGLKAVPVGQRASALQSALPQLQQAGIDPGPFAQLDESHLSDQQLDMFTATLGKAVEEYTLAPGAARYRGANKMAEQPLSPKFQVLKPGDTLVSTDPNDAGTVAGSNMPPTGTASTTPAQDPATHLDAQKFFQGFVLKHEGGLNPADMNGSPTNYGINQKAHPEVDVTKLTPEQAGQIFEKDYFTKYGADKLPPATAAVFADTAYINPKMAQRFLQESGGDPGKFMDLREQWMQGMVASNPAAQRYAHAWATRNADLRQLAGHLGSGAAQPAAAAAQGQAGAHVLYQAPAATEEDAPLSSDAVQLLAGKYLNNGTLPPMGMGKTGTRNRTLILNKATELAKTLGLDANDLVAGTVTGKAAGQALGKATTIRSQVEASENTVLKNGQAALSLADRVGGPTRVPVINRWIQAGRKNLAGDAEVAAFHIAVNTVATEYAKVMTTSTGTGGTTSDSARQDAERMINTAQTPEQLRAVISQMKVEMDNRAQSLRDVEAGLRNTVRNGGQPGGMGSGPAQAPAAASAPAAPPRPAAPRNRPPLSAIFR